MLMRPLDGVVAGMSHKRLTRLRLDADHGGPVKRPTSVGALIVVDASSLYRL
jgi:hypothetical protein